MMQQNRIFSASVLHCHSCHGDTAVVISFLLQNILRMLQILILQNRVMAVCLCTFILLFAKYRALHAKYKHHDKHNRNQSESSLHSIHLTFPLSSSASAYFLKHSLSGIKITYEKSYKSDSCSAAHKKTSAFRQMSFLTNPFCCSILNASPAIIFSSLSSGQ